MCKLKKTKKEIVQKATINILSAKKNCLTCKVGKI